MIEDAVILSGYIGLMGVGFIFVGLLEKVIVHFGHVGADEE